GSRWLGELAGHVYGERFERGFPVAVTVPWDAAGVERLIGAPGWGTIEELRTSIDTWRDHHDAMIALVTDASMAALRRLGASTAGARAARAAPPRPYTHVGFDPTDVEREGWPALLDALARLPSLGTIVLALPSRRCAPTALEPLLSSAIGAQARRLVMH